MLIFFAGRATYDESDFETVSYDHAPILSANVWRAMVLSRRMDI
jgi:hypothetical protein